MKANYITFKDLLYIVTSSIVFGAWLASIQLGEWLVGFASFTLIFLLAFVLLKISYAWSNGGKTLGYIIALAFFVRLAVGVTLHLALPIYGHEDEDDRAGYVFTDAHKRDDQAWKLASSEQPILDAFSKKYSSDQYGGLLAFNALIYRYLSPDAQRPLMLVLFSAFFAALGVPFLWKSVSQVFGDKVAWASTWIFALYPESVLLGAYAMREPYLLTFSAIALWGFVEWCASTAGLDAMHLNPPLTPSRDSFGSARVWVWLALGLLGMMLVSVPAALITIVIFAGWLFFADEKHPLSWKTIAVIAVVFVLGIVFLSLSLNRSGQFNASSPLSVINGWLKSTISLTAYNAEGDSGWVQKILGDRYGETVYKPTWYRLPFLSGYGILQPVLPAALIYPTKPIWRMIGIVRATGWYAMLPMLILSFVAAAGQGSGKTHAEHSRSIILWLSLVTWIWILLSALRGGGDLWDNPRYRTILFVWQSVLAGYIWVWWLETRNAWFIRVLACEAVFVLVFTQWYTSRYIKLGFQLPFAVMVALILGLWGVILGIGWWRDRQRA
jgi:hypothetical protein